MNITPAEIGAPQVALNAIYALPDLGEAERMAAAYAMPLPALDWARLALQAAHAQPYTSAGSALARALADMARNALLMLRKPHGPRSQVPSRRTAA